MFHIINNLLFYEQILDTDVKKIKNLVNDSAKML